MSKGKNTDYNYGEFYKEIKLIHDLSVPKEDQDWILTHPKDATPHEVVLYLGCNVLRTSHMIRTVYDIFKMLDVDFVAVGGGSFCCGSPYIREGDMEVAKDVNEHTVDSFMKFQPERVVMWCPSCLHNYDEVMDTEQPYMKQHVTQFLVEKLQQLNFVQEVPLKVAMHYHKANQKRRDEADAARVLFEALPGCEYIDIGSDERLSRHCTAEVQANLGPGGWDGIIDAQLNAAVEQGATTFATLYHGCQRLICPKEDERPIPIEHYLTVFARGLGIEYTDQYKQWKLWKDPSKVLQDMAPCMLVNNVDPAKAEAMVTRNFGA